MGLDTGALKLQVFLLSLGREEVTLAGEQLDPSTPGEVCRESPLPGHAHFAIGCFKFPGLAAAFAVCSVTPLLFPFFFQ